MIKIKLYDLLWRHKVKGYELAQAIEMSTATVSRLVQGDSNVKLSTIDKICKYFKCPLSEILEYVDD